MTSDSNIFMLCRGEKIICQLFFEKNNSPEIKELMSDNTDGEYILCFFTDQNLSPKNLQNNLYIYYPSTETQFFSSYVIIA